MSQQFYYPKIAAVLLFFVASCAKTSSAVSKAEDGDRKMDASLKTPAVGDTLLNMDYENGTINSGIAGTLTTNATASDAVYMAAPGATGNHAIAHKVVYGDSGYYSNDNWRSESSTNGYTSSYFSPGEERRYEFSVLLKDWPAWNTGDAANETNIFQLKTSGSTGAANQIRVKRNALLIRYAADGSTVAILPDFRPYVNQWIHFRIDVLWSNSGTGYMKIYTKLPGEPGYTLKTTRSNFDSFVGTGSNNGYIKWGLYVVPPNTTRIAWHDDIRIIALN